MTVWKFSLRIAVLNLKILKTCNVTNNGRAYIFRETDWGHNLSAQNPMLVPAKAGFQRESLGWKYECVTNNNNNHENHSGEMQKAADRHRPELPHNFFLAFWTFLMRKNVGRTFFWNYSDLELGSIFEISARFETISDFQIDQTHSGNTTRHAFAGRAPAGQSSMTGMCAFYAALALCDSYWQLPDFPGFPHKFTFWRKT